MPAPHHANGWELGVPFFAEGLELSLGIIDSRGTINPFQVDGHQLAILPGDEVQAVVHHVHEAELDYCPRVNRFNGVRKTGQTVDTGNQDIRHTSIPELGQHLQPLLGALALGNP